MGFRAVESGIDLLLWNNRWTRSYISVILYSIIAVISGFCTSLGATSTQTLPVTFARSSDALGGPATRVDPVEAPIEGSNHRRAQEQLALLRQRRASLTTQP